MSIPTPQQQAYTGLNDLFLKMKIMSPPSYCFTCWQQWFGSNTAPGAWVFTIPQATIATIQGYTPQLWSQFQQGTYPWDDQGQPQTFVRCLRDWVNGASGLEKPKKPRKSA